MIDKKWTFALLLATIAVAGAFASGDNENEDRGRSGPSGGGRQGMMAEGDRDGRERGPRLEDLETESYTGTFTMVENLYPALVTGGGETWYLMIPFNMEEESIPDEGADITVEAAESHMSPVHLMVVSAVVDGEELEIIPPESGGRGRKGMKGGGPSGQRPTGNG